MPIANASLNALGLAAGESAGTAHDLQTIAGGSRTNNNLGTDFERPSTLEVNGQDLPITSTLYTYTCLWGSAKVAGFASGNIDQQLGHWSWTVSDVSYTLGTKALTTTGNDGCTQQITFTSSGLGTVRCTYDDGFNTTVFNDFPIDVS